MTITITSGKAHGRTLLSAFDAALMDAGISYNLITLSSFIPPHGKIVLKKFIPLKDEWGNKLYVVKAAIQSDKRGEFIGAALGWYQFGDGRGMFVEHEAIGKSEKAVKKTLEEVVRTSLIDLCRFRKLPAIEKDMHAMTSIIEVKDSPAATAVVAIYKSEPW